MLGIVMDKKPGAYYFIKFDKTKNEMGKGIFVQMQEISKHLVVLDLKK